MFRGDWYYTVEEVKSEIEAISKAAALTRASYFELDLGWEQYGYEWSVFEMENGIEKKIWEGFKYIYSSKPNAGEIPALDLGNI